MSVPDYFSMLRDLSREYYQNHIGFDEYRAKRKSLLDRIDEELNGIKPVTQSSERQHDSSVFMKTISFFRNSDANE